MQQREPRHNYRLRGIGSSRRGMQHWKPRILWSIHDGGQRIQFPDTNKKGIRPRDRQGAVEEDHRYYLGC